MTQTTEAPGPPTGWPRPWPNPAPTLGGYVGAVVISWVALTVSGGAVAGLVDRSLDSLVFALAFYGMFGAVFGFVTAPFGVLLVHLSSLISPRQWTQALAAGAAGALAAYAVADFMAEAPRDWDQLTVAVGMCTAFGRAAVVPWVPAVHASFAPGTPWWRRFRLS